MSVVATTIKMQFRFKRKSNTYHSGVWYMMMAAKIKERRLKMAITLKAARINKGLTQTEAAKLLMINKDTLARYENEKSYPDVKMMKKIEQLYGIPYDDIIFLSINVGKSE